MLQAILSYVPKLITVLPNLIIAIENLWAPKQKAGPQKWVSVEAAVSGSIEDAAQAVAKLAPAGTKAQTISDAIAVFTKSVNDAFVKLMNDLGIFKADYTQSSPPPTPEG